MASRAKKKQLQRMKHSGVYKIRTGQLKGYIFDSYSRCIEPGSSTWKDPEGLAKSILELWQKTDYRHTMHFREFVEKTLP